MKIDEVFLDYYKAPKYASGFKDYAVHKNPTRKEMRELAEESSEDTIRFIADPDKEELYIFPNEILHEDAVKKIYNEKPGFLLFGLARKESSKYKAEFGQTYGKDVEQETYYEDILKKEWLWLDKYVDTAPMFTTVMRRHLGK